MTPPQVRIQQAASYRLDDIYRYTLANYGKKPAAQYINGLFAAFDGIASRKTLSRPIPAVFELQGYFFRYRHPVVSWRELSDGDIGIVILLHERMHQIDRFKAEFNADNG